MYSRKCVNREIKPIPFKKRTVIHDYKMFFLDLSDRTTDRRTIRKDALVRGVHNDGDLLRRTASRGKQSFAGSIDCYYGVHHPHAPLLHTLQQTNTPGSRWN